MVAAVGPHGIFPLAMLGFGAFKFRSDVGRFADAGLTGLNARFAGAFTPSCDVSLSAMARFESCIAVSAAVWACTRLRMSARSSAPSALDTPWVSWDSGRGSIR